MRLFARLLTASAFVLAQSTLTFAQEASATSLIAQARTRSAQGDSVAAARFFAEARALRPLTSGEMGEFFWTLRPVNPREALQVARDLLRATPSDGVIRDGAIATAMALGDESSVVAFAQEGRMLNDKSAHWHRRLGESLLRSGRGNEAAAMLGLAVQKFDAGPDDWMAYSVALTQAGRYQEAVDGWAHVPAKAIPNAPELHRVRLQAFRFGAAPALAAAEADTWLLAHPDDHLVRSWTVDLWERAGNPRFAYAAAASLGTPSEPHWFRRAGELARAAGSPDEALRAYEALLQTSAATVDDRRQFAALALDAGQFNRGAVVLDDVVGALSTCDDETLTLIDRLPPAESSARLAAAVVRLGCADSAWGRRAVARAVADGKHRDALSVLQRMAAKSDAERTLEGELLVRTNQPQQALAVLTPLLAVAPNEPSVRLSAIDAMRATGRSYDAFEAAQPLLRDVSLPIGSRLSFAELALTADRPATALDMLTRLPEPATSTTGGMLRGRALMALGRADEAARVFGGMNARSLDAPAAAAAIDSVYATRGAHEALAYSSIFGAHSPDWDDVSERQLRLAEIVGDENLAAAQRQRLCGRAPQVCAIADASAQLALDQPLNALATLQGATALPVPYQERADDLRALALERIDRVEEAAAIMSRLHAHAPAHAGFAARAAFLSWRLKNDTTSLAALESLTREFPDDPVARNTLARALHLTRRHEDAIKVLTDAGAPPLTRDGRFILAEAMRGIGDVRAALAVIADVVLSSDREAILKSDLQASQGLRAEAIDTLRTWTVRPRVSESVFMAWSALEASGQPRVDVLLTAGRKLPTSARIAAALASERLSVGDRVAARGDAERALELDRSFAPAWTAVLDTTAALGSDRELNDRVKQLREEAERTPSLLTAVAEYVATQPRGWKTDLARQLVSMLRTFPASRLSPVSRHMSIARLEAGLDEWTAALTAVEAARRLSPDSADVLALRAEITARAGRYSDAVDAWSDYLTREPGALAARRKQAYSAGMAGRYGDARRMYAQLQAAFPQDPVVTAEAAARLAFYDRRWRDAVTAYASWLAVEPGNADARFEHAMALENAGHQSAAAQVLSALSEDGHQAATDAVNRAREARMPVFLYSGSRQNANGFGGLRDIEFRRDGGVIDYQLRSSARVKLLASGDRIRFADATRAIDGVRGEFGGTYAWSSRLTFDVSVRAWVYGSRALPTATTRSNWMVGDRTALNAGFAFAPVQENLNTVDARLSAAGPFAGIRLDSADADLTVRAAWQRLSDGNSVMRLDAAGGRVVSERLRGVRLLGAASTFSYARSVNEYFSPSRFLRVDGGVEYTHAFLGNRSVGEPPRRLQVAFLEGADNRGVLYHQPRVSLGLGLSRWLFLSSTASATRSSTYRDSTFTIDIGVVNLSANR